jgi:hypothetical protein
LIAWFGRRAVVVQVALAQADTQAVAQQVREATFNKLFTFQQTKQSRLVVVALEAETKLAVAEATFLTLAR